MPTPNGLPQALKAMPHSATAHDGSASSVDVNAAVARPNSNECSRATARLNRGCAAALQDVANDTVPSCSLVEAACSWSCAAAEAASITASVNADVFMRIIEVLYDASQFRQQRSDLGGEVAPSTFLLLTSNSICSRIADDQTHQRAGRDDLR